MDTVVIVHPERGPVWVGTNSVNPARVTPRQVVQRFVAIREALDEQIERGDFDPPVRYYG